MLYEVTESYTPPHQLVFMCDADKGLESIIERYFSNTLHTRYVLHLVKNYKNNSKKTLGLKFAHFSGINKNVTMSGLQVQC